MLLHFPHVPASYIVANPMADIPRQDRGRPGCGWCSRNGQLCEYKERKKPGLRAGYGKELEQRLGWSSPVRYLVLADLGKTGWRKSFGDKGD